jgi:hypothetical protein
MSAQGPHDLHQQQLIPNKKKNKTLGMLHSIQSGSQNMYKTQKSNEQILLW